VALLLIAATGLLVPIAVAGRGLFQLEVDVRNVSDEPITVRTVTQERSVVLSGRRLTPGEEIDMVVRRRAEFSLVLTWDSDSGEHRADCGLYLTGQDRLRIDVTDHDAEIASSPMVSSRCFPLAD
jgi:hypothetical protein